MFAHGCQTAARQQTSRTWFQISRLGQLLCAVPPGRGEAKLVTFYVKPVCVLVQPHLFADAGGMGTLASLVRM